MKKHIFLIGENKDEMLFFIEVLDGMNISYKCTWAQDGEQALSRLPYLWPDIVFLDMTLPVMNGLQCLAAIKRSPRLREIPVIMQSIAIDGWAEAQTLGAADYLIKPATVSCLENIFRGLDLQAELVGSFYASKTRGPGF